MPTVKSYLKSLSKPQLELLVLDLSKRNPQVKQFLELMVAPGKSKAVFDRYGNKLVKCFPRPPKEPDLAGARQLVVDYAQVGNEGELAMMLMWHAALGAKYTHDFGDMGEEFYEEFESSFEAALALAKKHDMVESFRVPADEVARYADGIGYGFADEIQSIYAEYFGEAPPLDRPTRTLRGARPESKKSGRLVQGEFGNGSNNPFDAIAPNEVLCVESRPITTRQDGTIWLYVAMDAHSRYLFHHALRPASSLPEYLTFIMDVLKKYPALKSATLAVDTPVAMGPALNKVFPHFQAVLGDKKGVAEVTVEFHTAFLAHMGQQGRDN